MSLDATRIAPRLYQGGQPPSGYAVTGAGFDVLVLCAEEIQPPDRQFPMMQVLRCPLDDDFYNPVSDETWDRVVRTAERVALHVKHQERVLVTCRKGLNRSGIVTAASLHFISGVSGSRAAAWVQRHRYIMDEGQPWRALCNPQFYAALSTRLR